MFPEETVLVGFLIGAAIGSFLNVLIYRMPRGLSISSPAYSFCPSCKTPLGLADLIPLFSWLFSKGRCRYCGSKVASRYFWVEMANGLIYAGIWWNYLVAGQEPAYAIAYALAASMLVAIIWIDWEFYIIPDEINAFLWFIGILLNIFFWAGRLPQAFTWGMPTALTGWLMGVGVLWGIAFLGRVVFRKDAMGHGDIKMARGIGAVLGPIPALLSFGLAVILGAVIGMVQVATLKGKQAPEPEVEEDDEPYEPESIGSLLKCGLGYVLLIDILGLFFPKLYENWFGEPLRAEIMEEDDFEVTHTMIPFGPYLALGAIVAVVFQSQLLGLVDSYLNWVTPNP